MSDMIYRQDAIDAVSRGCQEFRGIFAECEKNLNVLPSAQPEVIHCRECRHHHYESKDIPYCGRIDYGYGWKDNDFCSKGERRTDE